MLKVNLYIEFVGNLLFTLKQFEKWKISYNSQKVFSTSVGLHVTV